MSGTDTSTLAGHPAGARLIRAGQRLARFDTRHRWALDTLVVALFFLNFCLPDLFRDADHTPSTVDLTVPQMLGLQLALAVPLWWRRRAPQVTFHVVLVVFLAQCGAGILIRADVAVAVALYSLVRHGRLDRLVWAAPAAIASSVLVAARLSDWVSLSDVLFFLLVVYTAAISLAFAMRLRHAHVATLRERAARLEVERDQRDRLAAATERTRVAREMHDIVGHSLSVIITLADAGAYAVGAAPERGREALRLIGDTGRRSLAELRRTVGVLRERDDEPDLAPQPGLGDLDALCGGIREAGPRVEYESAGDLAALDRGVQVTAYRIVQEALTNAMKHAGPRTTIRLSLRAEGDRLRIRVRDTGPPGGAAARAGEPGHGLIGMRERAELYGGTVTAGEAPGGGWQVDADLDLRAQGSPA